ncbi:LegC family aminotransferase [Nitrosomonadales bacterium]|nr:LegC family aminotransferase [Nitrosomonadales bacterium]
MQKNLQIGQQIINSIHNVIGVKDCSLHEPVFDGNEWHYMKECLDSTYVSSVGKFVGQFEQSLVDLTGAKYAIALVNGTAAIHLALILADVAEGDEVLAPTFTFVATANAISYLKATPHFVDNNEDTLGVDPKKLYEYLNKFTKQKDGKCINLKTNKIIKAIIPTHVFGHPCKIDEIVDIARKFNILVIEDAAESIGSYYKNKHTGTFGLMGTLSFNGNKTITTGGGGAILTNNKEIAKKAKHLSTTAKLDHKWDYLHDEIGFNYRLPNINAALGCAQLEQLPKLLKSKRLLFKKYEDKISLIKGVSLFKEPKECKSNYWLQTLLLDFQNKNNRDEILSLTNENGLMTRPAWILMHRLKQFNNNPRMNLSCSESIADRLINIPSSSNLIGKN